MPVNVGIIGAGQIAGFHAEAIAACGATLSAVTDVDYATGQRLAARTGAEHCLDVDDLLADTLIQAIVIATPNASHCSLALSALDAGKDVLCEKPLTTSADDSALLVRAAREHPDRIFQVGYMKRFNPGFLLFGELLDQIGAPVFAAARVLAERRPNFRETWYGQPASSGGGILTHSGSHLIDVIRFLLGEPIRVDARIQFAPDLPDLDLSTQALIDLETGLTVQFSAVSTPASVLGHTGEGWDESIEVIGEGGRLRLSSPNWQGTAPCLITLQQCGEREVRTLLPMPGSQWVAEMRAFLSSLETRQPASPGVVDGYRVDEVLAALYASAKDKAPIEVRWRC